MDKYMIDLSNVSENLRNQILTAINFEAWDYPSECIDKPNVYTFFLENKDLSCLNLPSDCKVTQIDW